MTGSATYLYENVYPGFLPGRGEMHPFAFSIVYLIVDFE